MPLRSTEIIPGLYYHFYNRGVNKEKIFFSPRNYEFFLEKLEYYCKDKAGVISYCLMPNHFHLLVKIFTDDFIEESLRPLLVSYSKAVNKEQTRVGPLFQGRYQVKGIEGDGNIVECSRYIHLNPVKAGLVNSPEEWSYSSFRYYQSPETKSFVDTSYVLTQFNSQADFSEYTQQAIERCLIEKTGNDL
jgi:REP element-mobilizing transposase RayT